VGTLCGYMQGAIAHDSGVLHVDPAGDYEDASSMLSVPIYGAAMLCSGGVKFLQLSVLLYARNGFPDQ